MTKKLLYISLLMASGHVGAYAIAPGDIQMHCKNDTTEINTLLIKGYESGKTSPNEIMAMYAHDLLDKPYVGGTLEGDSEKLVINVDQLDCTTFVETLCALTRCTLNGRYSWRDYAKNLEDIRYRNGQLDGYASRLHYISNWIVDNNHRGNLIEVTADHKDVRYLVRTLNFMSRNSEKYPALADSANLAQIKKAEGGYSNHRFPYLKKEIINAKNLKGFIKEGDIIAIVTKMDNLDVQHMGVITMVDGVPHLLHASSAAKKVVIEKDDLFEYLRRNRSAIGIRVIRIKE